MPQNDSIGHLKLTMERLVNLKRFNGEKMYDECIIHLENILSISSQLEPIKTKLDAKCFKYTIKGLLRNVFFIELVNNDVSTTHMETRWTKKDAGGKKQEAFNESDPRYCSFEGCFSIFTNLLYELNNAMETDKTMEMLNKFQKYNLLPYEIPIDYFDNYTHSKEYIHWFWNENYMKTISLRANLINRGNPYKHIFNDILRKKIQVKTYLSDRVQTGDFKTDREKRWEVHPKSVHFATRRACLEIEYTLLNQLAHFKYFPNDLFQNLVSIGLINDNKSLFKCPVTLDPLSFEDLKSEVENRTHGKSKFQVGHLNPLKSREVNHAFGHDPKNVSWISENGNRIQGNLSLKETRDLLKRILQNYSKEWPQSSFQIKR